MSAIAATEPRAVDVDAIERELHDLLFGDGGGEPASSDAVATRACMSNLLVWTSSRADAACVEDDLREIAERHPSRILLLIGSFGEGEPDTPLDAHVSAVCHLGDGGRRVCSEHVVLQAGPSDAHRLASVARTLLIGDLPTSLWWASSTPPATGGLYADLREMAEQVIVDTASWPEDASLVDLADQLARQQRSHGVVSDLAWSRLEAWRGVLIQALDPLCAPGALVRLSEVRVEHGPHSLAEALLLLGWLASRLGWRLGQGSRGDGPSTTWKAESSAGPLRLSAQRATEGHGLLRVDLRWGDADGERLEVARVDGGRLATTGPCARPTRVLAAAAPSRAALMARQLADLSGDPTHGDALAVAAALARGVAP